MGTAVGSYSSKSKPGKEYRIIMPDGGGELYCECWQWKMKRTCSHLEDFLHKAKESVPEFIKSNLSPKNHDALQHAIDIEVARLAGI